MSRAPRLLRIAGVVVGGIAALACAVVPVLAVTAPWPSVAATPASIDQTSRPGETLLACDGPLLALGRDPSKADEITVADAPSAVQKVVTGESTPLELRIVGVRDASAESLAISPEGETPGAGAKAQTVSITAEDVAGFAPSACRVPAVDSWIVGADSATGTTGLLRLSNPGDVDAPVTITVYGTGGPVGEGPGAFVVPARTQLVVPLAGISGGNARSVVRVSAQASAVSATLQTSTVETLTPVGIDMQASAAAPAPRQSIPAAVVGEDGVADVRLLAPDSGGKAQIVPVAADGRRGDAVSVELTAGQPVDARLQGLTEGRYTLEISATVPVVSAARTEIAQNDFAWFPSASDITGSATVATAEGPAATLTLVNAGDAEARVELALGSTTTEVALPAGAVVHRSLAKGTVVRVTAKGTVRGAVSYSSDTQLGGYPLWPDTTAGGQILVVP